MKINYSYNKKRNTTMILTSEYLYNIGCEFMMVFGDNYVGKSYCLNKFIANNFFTESNNMFEDGTLEYQCVLSEDGNLNIIDTPGLNSILQHQGFSSFKKIWEYIKNKQGLILLCIDCKQTRFSNTLRKFTQMIDFFNSKTKNKFEINMLFNRYKNNETCNNMIKEFKSRIPLKLSGFYAYCDENGKNIRFENEPYLLRTTSGFKYLPNSFYNKDFKIPIGDTTIVKKSFDAKLGKDILLIIWQIQQEFDIPFGAITGNKKLADLLYEYNFGQNKDENKLREIIIQEIDNSLIFE